MPARPTAIGRTAAAPLLGLGLALLLGAAGAADGPRPPGPGAPAAAEDAATGEPLRLAAGEPPPADPPAGPLGTVERLRIKLLGGNPIFALDWLAPGLEPEGGRPRPRLPLP